MWGDGSPSSEAKRSKLNHPDSLEPPSLPTLLEPLNPHWYRDFHYRPKLTSDFFLLPTRLPIPTHPIKILNYSIGPRPPSLLHLSVLPSGSSNSSLVIVPLASLGRNSEDRLGIKSLEGLRPRNPQEAKKSEWRMESAPVKVFNIALTLPCSPRLCFSQ